MKFIVEPDIDPFATLRKNEIGIKIKLDKGVSINFVPGDVIHLGGTISIKKDETLIEYSDSVIYGVQSILTWLADQEKKRDTFPNTHPADKTEWLDTREIWKKTHRIFTLEFHDGLQIKLEGKNIVINDFNPGGAKEIKRVFFKNMKGNNDYIYCFDLMRPTAEGEYGIDYKIKETNKITINKNEFIKKLTTATTEVINELIQQNKNLKNDEDILKIQKAIKGLQ